MRLLRNSKAKLAFHACKYFAKFPAIKAYGICTVVRYELIGKCLQ